MGFTDYLSTLRGSGAPAFPVATFPVASIPAARASELFVLLTAALVVAACASRGGAGLAELKAGQRHQLYKDCVASQMKVASFGSGAAVHRACLDWARRQL